MDVFDYEQRRNENVIRKAGELRKLLESSSTCDSVVNNVILEQAV
jgi:hypothetical protein